MRLLGPIVSMMLLVCVASPSHEAPTGPVAAIADPGQVALQDVRLRKLHLVRPDLIPYPLYVEVVC